jgi:hypothetical protein
MEALCQWQSNFDDGNRHVFPLLLANTRPLEGYKLHFPYLHNKQTLVIQSQLQLKNKIAYARLEFKCGFEEDMLYTQKTFSQ